MRGLIIFASAITMSAHTVLHTAISKSVTNVPKTKKKITLRIYLHRPLKRAFLLVFLFVLA